MNGSVQSGVSTRFLLLSSFQEFRDTKSQPRIADLGTPRMIRKGCSTFRLLYVTLNQTGPRKCTTCPLAIDTDVAEAYGARGERRSAHASLITDTAAPVSTNATTGSDPSWICTEGVLASTQGFEVWTNLSSGVVISSLVDLHTVA